MSAAERDAKVNGGRCAFATPANEDYSGSDGLSKREYFAAVALQGLLASGKNWPVGQFANTAVDIADELLLELER